MSTLALKKTILCAWEIGGELGHISNFSAITKALELEGHHIVLAFKDFSRAYPFFKDTKAILMQAPVWLPKVTMQRPIACLADTLLCMGYREDEELDCLVQAWESIIALVKPDLIIFDYAPTAMLALVNNPLPKILIGTGFADPVTSRSIVDWRPYPTNDGLVQRQEQMVLERINKVLGRRDKPELKHFTELFAVDHTVISTFPELDLYRDRENATYSIGPSEKLVAEEVRFVSEDRPRILAYLKPGHPNINLLVAALAQCKASVFVACPKGSAQLFAPYVSDRFQFSLDLVDLQGAMGQVDLFVGHGNASSCKESLIAGNPMVILPIQLEQLLTGRKLQEAGFGVLVEKIPSVDELVELLDYLLDNSESYRVKINALLDRHPEPRLNVADAIKLAVKRLLD
jgi:UDP:flavonoid glycosyltransferase YjiC (YdhE family)